MKTNVAELFKEEGTKKFYFRSNGDWVLCEQYPKSTGYMTVLTVGIESNVPQLGYVNYTLLLCSTRIKTNGIYGFTYAAGKKITMYLRFDQMSLFNSPIRGRD